MNTFTGWASTLNTIVHTSGQSGTPNQVRGQLPGVSCNVFVTGSTTLAAISSSEGTPFPNPFLVKPDGSFSFYGLNTDYDLIFSAGTSTSVVVTTVSPVIVLTAQPLLSPPYATGDMFYADTPTNISRLPVGGAGTVIVGGPSPSYSSSPMLTRLVINNQPIGGWLLSGTTFFDDFGRSDTAAGTLGTAPSGGTWDLRGQYISGYPLPAATTGQIVNGRFVTTGGITVYATQTLRVTPSRIGARVRWSAGNGGVQHGSLALIISSDSNFINDMLHFRTDPDNWDLQIRIAGGAFVDLASGSFSPSLMVDGSTSYPMEISVAGNTVTLNLAGEIFSITDPRVSARLGKWVVWEEAYNNAATYQDFLSIESVWTGSSPIGPVIGGTVFAENGLLATPAYTFAADPDSGMFSYAEDVIAFVTGGSRRAYFAASGMVLDNGLAWAVDNAQNIGTPSANRPATGYFGTSVVNAGFYEGTEMTAPAAGSVNTGRLYFEDNGAGKTRLMCLFNTGAAQQIAIQP